MLEFKRQTAHEYVDSGMVISFKSSVCCALPPLVRVGAENDVAGLDSEQNFFLHFFPFSVTMTFLRN